MRAIAHSSSKPPGRFGFISPTYTQSKDVAWEYLKSYSRPFVSELPNESELRVDLWNGSRIRLYGADNPDSLRGLGFDAIVIDEYADVSPNLFPAVLRPALADRKGRCTFIGTPTLGENSHGLCQIVRLLKFEVDGERALDERLLLYAA